MKDDMNIRCFWKKKSHRIIATSAPFPTVMLKFNSGIFNFLLLWSLDVWKRVFNIILRIKSHDHVDWSLQIHGNQGTITDSGRAI